MSEELICIGMLSALYVYQTYRLFKLEKFVLKHLSDVWKFQHMVVDVIDKISKRI